MIVCFTAESCLCDENQYNGSKRQEEMTEIRSYTITDFQWEIVLLKIHWISTVSTNKFWKTALPPYRKLDKKCMQFYGLLAFFNSFKRY